MEYEHCAVIKRFMKKKFLWNLAIYSMATILSCSFLSCESNSTYESKTKGEKAADEVIAAIEKGDGDEAKRLMQKYSLELKGQDLVDFGQRVQMVTGY